MYGPSSSELGRNVKSRTSRSYPLLRYRLQLSPHYAEQITFYHEPPRSASVYLPTDFHPSLAFVHHGPHVYLWSEARTKTIPDSLTVPASSAHVTSLSFSSHEGGSAILAIGRADGRITLWSPLDRDPRFDSEQPAPVSCVTFRPNTVRRKSVRDHIATVATEELLVGDEIGSVYYYSVEWPDQNQRDLFDWHGRMTLLARITCHSQLGRRPTVHSAEWLSLWLTDGSLIRKRDELSAVNLFSIHSCRHMHADYLT